jgi:hypothetical protein
MLRLLAVALLLSCSQFLIAIAESRAGACASVDTEQCDARYDPVCANWDTGIRCIRAPCPSAELRLYTNACLACRDKRVNSFQRGECAERPEPENGQRYRVELDAFVGRRSQNDRSMAIVDVDLKVSEPIIVSRAWIRIEGEASPGSAESLEPGEGVIEMPVQVQASLRDSFSVGSFNTGQSVVQLGPFEGRFKAEGALGSRNAPYFENTWSMLSDGKAQLKLSFSSTCPAGCRFLEDAVIDIQRAELVVDFIRESDLPHRDG